MCPPPDVYRDSSGQASGHIVPPFVLRVLLVRSLAGEVRCRKFGYIFTGGSVSRYVHSVVSGYETEILYVYMGRMHWDCVPDNIGSAELFLVHILSFSDQSHGFIR